MMWFKKPESPKSYQTPFGEFIKENGGWESYIEINDEAVRITTDDINGETNPRLLHIIPLIQKNLSHFQAMARDAVEPLSPQHEWDPHYEFDSICINNRHPDTDFTLEFICSIKGWTGGLYVEFKDGKVLSWWSSD